MKKIITISREFGAGGGEIGREVANKLGYDYFDKAIILRAAKESNVDVESLLKWDERVPTNFGFAQSLFDFYNKPLNEKLFEIQMQVIREIGEKGNCVIVGRNANSILSAFDHSLHVFVHAKLNWRMNRMKDTMEGVLPSRVQDEVKAIDRARKKYCSYYTNTEFGVADYYDLSMNTSSLGVERCVDIICELAK